MAEKSKITQLDPKVRYVMDKYQNSKDYHRPVRSKWTVWDDQYFSVPQPKKHSWMANVFDPETHKAVMTLLTRVVNNTFSVDPAFDVVPSNKDVSNLIRAQLYRGDFLIKWVFYCLQLLIRGTSIGRVSWQKDVRTKFTLEKVMENVVAQVEAMVGGQTPPSSRYTRKPKQVVRYDGPIFEVIDLFDFFPEPNAIEITDGAKVFRSTIPKSQFMRNSNYAEKEKVLRSEMPEVDGWFHSRLKSIGLRQPDFKQSEDMPTDRAKRMTDYVQLLECETEWYNPKTRLMEPWLITIANQEYIVRDEHFPYWNTNTTYVKGTWIPVLNEYYGIGIPELAECLQEELNDKKNQRLDNLNQILQGGWLLYEEGAVDPRVMSRFEPKPGAKLRCRPGAVSGGAVRHEYLQDVTSTVNIEIAALKGAIEEVTGAVKAIQPSNQGSDIHRTSSGIMLLQNMANERIKFNLNLLEKQVLEPVYEKYYDLNLQFLTPGYHIFDADGKPGVYDPAKIAGDYEFRPKGSRYALDQQMKITGLSRTLEALGASGLPIGELHIRLWMRLYDAMGFEDKKEIEAILRDEIKKQQQMQQQLAMAKAGGGQGGGGAQPGAGNPMMDEIMNAMNVPQTKSDAGQMIPGGGG